MGESNRRTLAVKEPIWSTFLGLIWILLKWEGWSDWDVLRGGLIYCGFEHPLIPPNHSNSRVPKLGVVGLWWEKSEETPNDMFLSIVPSPPQHGFWAWHMTTLDTQMWLRWEVPGLGLTDEDVGLLREVDCDIVAPGMVIFWPKA
jgi:hypothetical protein